MTQWLIDPAAPISFNRTDEELELFWLFCGVVAGKTAKVQAQKLARFLERLPGTTPFVRIEQARLDGQLVTMLMRAKLGQYRRLGPFMTQSAARLAGKLKTCTLGDLESIHGVGPKTARMFLMFTRPNQRYAALDTHVLKHLKAEGYDVPKVTPSGKRYLELEQTFLGLADASGMSVADYDLMIWKRYAKS